MRKRKQIVRLNESQLNSIIKESVKRILNERRPERILTSNPCIGCYKEWKKNPYFRYNGENINTVNYNQRVGFKKRFEKGYRIANGLAKDNTEKELKAHNIVLKLENLFVDAEKFSYDELFMIDRLMKRGILNQNNIEEYLNNYVEKLPITVIISSWYKNGWEATRRALNRTILINGIGTTEDFENCLKSLGRLIDKHNSYMDWREESIYDDDDCRFDYFRDEYDR